MDGAITDPIDPPEAAPRNHHDLGGVSRFVCQPIDTKPHALDAFDRSVDAIRGILGEKRVMSVDELRRGIESLPEADYLALSYYQRWLRAIVGILLEKGVVTEAELRRAMAAGAE